MAAASQSLSRFQNHSDEDLSDDQIQQLLRDAENRLRAGGVGLSEDNKLADRVDSTSRLAKLNPGNVPASYVNEKDGIARVDPTYLLDDEQKKLANTIRRVENPIKRNVKTPKDHKPTAGSNWFDLPRTTMTSELKKDLQLLRMRPVLDPKRHYKKESGKGKVPEYSQVGTVIEGPTEFYSARIPNKERKRTFVDETLAYEEESGRFKAKYEDIQVAKTSGKKAHYKTLKDKRKRLRR